MIVCDCPAKVATSVPAERFWTTPSAMRTTVPMTAIGSRMRRLPLTRSTQKFPRRSVRERTNALTSATATAMPTAAETKFCTANPLIWAKCPMVDSPE